MEFLNIFKTIKNTSLLIDKRFWPICGTQFFGAFNDNFFKNALLILITFSAINKTEINAKTLIALCGGIFIFPFFLFSSLSGQIADKFEKSQLIIKIKILEFFIMILAVVGFYTNNLPLLLFILFLMGLQSTLFSPLKYSYIPQILPQNKLLEANALFQIVALLAILLGTIAGGLVITSTQNGIFYVSMGVIIFSIIGFLFSLCTLKTTPLKSSVLIQYNIFYSTWNLISYIWSYKNTRAVILSLSWFWFHGSALISLLPTYGKNILGVNEPTVIFLFTLSSVGISLGCFICKKLSASKIKLQFCIIGLLGSSVLLLDLFIQSYIIYVRPQETILFIDFITNPIHFRIIFDLIMLSVLEGLFLIPLITLLQIIAPPKQRAQIIAGGNIFNSFFIVLAAIMLIFCFYIGLTESHVFLILSVLNLIMVRFIYKLYKRFSKII